MLGLDFAEMFLPVKEGCWDAFGSIYQVSYLESMGILNWQSISLLNCTSFCLIQAVLKEKFHQSATLT